MREMKPEQEDSREIKDELQLPEEEKPGFWGDSLADSGERIQMRRLKRLIMKHADRNGMSGSCFAEREESGTGFLDRFLLYWYCLPAEGFCSVRISGSSLAGSGRL